MFTKWIFTCCAWFADHTSRQLCTFHNMNQKLVKSWKA